MKEQIIESLKTRIRLGTGLVALGCFAWLLCSFGAGLNFWHQRLGAGVLNMALASLNLSLLLHNGRDLAEWRRDLAIIEREWEEPHHASLS